MQSQYLKKPNLSKTINQKQHPKFILTSCEMQGWRRTMQDTQIYTQLAKDIHLFAVFDGHGGPQVAHYAAKHLPTQLLNEPYFKLKNYHKALSNVFQRIDHLISSQRGQVDLKKLNSNLKGSKVKEDQKIGFRAGTTAVAILMTNDKIYTSNIGDSRAVLCRSSKAISLSTDHKPDLPAEHNRIQKAGGYVQKNRINGSLNLSRAFGDFEFKANQKGKQEQQLVICIPQVIQTIRSPQDEYILMGCDGVWQKHVSNNQKMITNLSQLLEKHDPKTAIDKLYTQLVAKNDREHTGFDNMTSILIKFL